MRAVLDVNVIISALLSRRGSPARILRLWQDAQFDLIISPLLLGELQRALAHPKIQQRISRSDAANLIRLLESDALVTEDPSEAPPLRSADPGDDYLLALAASSGAVLVSGDAHLLNLAESAAIFSPSAFLNLLEPLP